MPTKVVSCNQDNIFKSVDCYFKAKVCLSNARRCKTNISNKEALQSNGQQFVVVQLVAILLALPYYLTQKSTSATANKPRMIFFMMKLALAESKIRSSQ